MAAPKKVSYAPLSVLEFPWLHSLSPPRNAIPLSFLHGKLQSIRDRYTIDPVERRTRRWLPTNTTLRETVERFALESVIPDIERTFPTTFPADAGAEQRLLDSHVFCASLVDRFEEGRRCLAARGLTPSVEWKEKAIARLVRMHATFGTAESKDKVVERWSDALSLRIPKREVGSMDVEEQRRHLMECLKEGVVVESVVLLRGKVVYSVVDGSGVAVVADERKDVLVTAVSGHSNGWTTGDVGWKVVVVD